MGCSRGMVRLAALSLAVVGIQPALAATTELVSRNALGGVGSNSSQAPTISADGLRVAFISNSVNLVRPDANNRDDVFVYFRASHKVALASVSSEGVQSNGRTSEAQIAGNGQSVAFVTDASNLVPGVTDGSTQVYVRDLKHGTTVLASVGSSDQPVVGGLLGAISNSGRYVVFDGFAPYQVSRVYVRDIVAGTTKLVSVGMGGKATDGASYGRSVSDDGRYVVFGSFATNVVPGDTNGSRDVFVRDMVENTTTLVTVGLGGAIADSGSSGVGIAEGGRYVAFTSDAHNLVPGNEVPSSGYHPELYLRDLKNRTTRLVSVTSAGKPATYVAFSALSGDGGTVAFLSNAPGIVPGDTNNNLDVFVRDLSHGVTERVSVANSGAEARGGSEFFGNGILSRDGRVVAFTSHAPNLVPADPNPRPDVYVRVR